MTKNTTILGIETSCDETAAAVVRDGRDMLSNVIYSQIPVHQPYGGVVPEVASRNHVNKIDGIVEMALEKASISFKDIDAVAVTYGPGLIGSLLVGLSYAKSLAYSLRVPLIGVNHIEGHICANYIDHKELTPPFITLVASGGHTNIVVVKDYGVYEVLGQTRDDAAGEAFDKISRSLGLGYPGGPAIDKAAKEGNPHAVEFPRAYLEEDSYDFSFSGLKSAVLNYLNSAKMKGEEININDVAASFQMSVVEVLVNKTVSAALKYGLKKVCLSGGVGRNSLLRKLLEDVARDKDLKVYFPEKELCSDNAAMIASAGYFNYIRGLESSLDLNAVPNLKLKNS